MSAPTAAHYSENARRLLLEIIRDAKDLHDLLGRAAIGQAPGCEPYYARYVEAAYREMGAASREAYRHARAGVASS